MAAIIGPALLHRLVAERAGIDLSDTEKVLAAHEEVVLSLIAEGAQVRAIGGGLLKQITTKPTRRTNPHTGGTVQVPSKIKIVYRVTRKRKDD